MPQVPPVPPNALGRADPAAQARIASLERRLLRERRARLEVEEIAERATRTLYDKQRSLVLFEAVVSASSESATEHEALQGAVDAVCTHTGWPVGHASVLDPASGELRPNGIWHVERPEQFAAFCSATDRTAFVAGVGLPGQVSATGRPAWIGDTRLDGGFQRKDLGVRGACAFPVMVGGEVAAVLEFFTAGPVAPDPELVVVMEQIGRQLGRVVERLRAHELIAHQATHDGLTGLANRLLLRDRLEGALARAERQGALAAVLFLDLDRFKDINDTLGHTVGDELLGLVSERLQGALRSKDAIARPGEEPYTLARFGGDEFVVLCEGLAMEADAVRIAERVREALLAPFVLNQTEHRVSASMGIVVASGVHRDAEALLRDADIAMYRAKLRGPGRWEIFDEALRRRAIERVAVERGLRRALEVDELELHYQPIVALDGGAIAAVEALVRWRHPERGLLTAGEFVPIAEESGLILELGTWTLRTACAQARRWRDTLGDAAPLPVTVNLGARHFSQADLPQTIQEVLAATGLDPRDLAIELTETALIEESGVPAASLEAIRALGVEVYLDDFGTGYSSLSHLQRFPIDALKIDREFVLHLGARDENHAIVRAIIAMADALGLRVVAEGVQTASQAAEVQALGCALAQGNHFARAFPAVQLEVMLSPGALLDASVVAPR